MSKIKNPIIPGYYPDPSICRVGEDYYLACSSFELYPGIPLFHSKDLMHWEQICNVMTMDNGFHVERSYGGNGVMAPTIRYNKGIFYIINANFSDKGNYIVTATDPRGPWSEPHYMTDVPGIDASLFFDNDGTCYVIGTGNVWDNGTGIKERGIWIAEYDIANFKMIGEPVTIFNSALRGGASPEAPHIFHIGNYYYLIIAEGGTAHYHCVAVARSREVFGFYENNPANPIMTHRMMGTFADLSNVGHSDLVDTPNGDWYAVMLASRNQEGVYKNIGRETYICPVQWEWEWPLFSPKTGRLDFEYDGTGLPETIYEAENSRDEFDCSELPLYWTLWGTPYRKYYKIEDSALQIQCIPQSMVRPLEKVVLGSERKLDSFAPFIARRQRQFSFCVSCKMNFHPQNQETAGIAMVQAMNHQYRMERVNENGEQYLQVVLSVSDFNGLPFLPFFQAETKENIIARVRYEKDEIVLRIEEEGEALRFLYGESEEQMILLAQGDARLISTEKLGCLSGTMIGMFASANGNESENYAKFDWFELK